MVRQAALCRPGSCPPPLPARPPGPKMDRLARFKTEIYRGHEDNLERIYISSNKEIQSGKIHSLSDRDSKRRNILDFARRFRAAKYIFCNEVQKTYTVLNINLMSCMKVEIYAVHTSQTSIHHVRFRSITTGVFRQ